MYGEIGEIVARSPGSMVQPPAPAVTTRLDVALDG
jgi:hypothetical protein